MLFKYLSRPHVTTLHISYVSYNIQCKIKLNSRGLYSSLQNLSKTTFSISLAQLHFSVQYITNLRCVIHEAVKTVNKTCQWLSQVVRPRFEKNYTRNLCIKNACKIFLNVAKGLMASINHNSGKEPAEIQQTGHHFPLTQQNKLLTNNTLRRISMSISRTVLQNQQNLSPTVALSYFVCPVYRYTLCILKLNNDTRRWLYFSCIFLRRL